MDSSSIDLEKGKENIAATEEQYQRVEGLLNLLRLDVRGERPLIPRVRASLVSNVNKECYQPQTVSIGPYHHGKRHLQRIGYLKMQMVKDFIRNKTEASASCAADEQLVYNYNVQRMYNSVAKMERENWYAADATRGMSDKDFAQMMFLDGCFVLQFMSCCIDNRFKFGDVEMTQSDINSVQKDLVLLENQLPFMLLEALEGDRSVLLRKFAYFMFRVSYLPFAKLFKLMNYPLTPKHFLHYLHLFHFNPEDFKADNLKKHSVDHYTYPSVKELKKAGIRPRPSPSWSYSEVRFSYKLLAATAKLQLPRMHVNYLTKPILLNLAAYEMDGLSGEGAMAASFICFMDKLIDDKEDVKELRSAGVLYSALGSDDTLARLFSTMGKDLAPDPKLYDARLISQIDDYYNRQGWRIWFYKTIYYFIEEQPWSVLAYVVAILAFGLTAIQTYYAIHPAKGH